ncbi:hypothetical protein Q5O14_02775 [Eubacteriaceae bacterium ES2]|nr:hypothetical protein Q5O14_02775 [Eubacteriaceae bacterium ES2]
MKVQGKLSLLLALLLLMSVIMTSMIAEYLNIISVQWIKFLITSVGVILGGEAIAYPFFKKTLEPFKRINENIQRLNLVYFDKKLREMLLMNLKIYYFS